MLYVKLRKAKCTSAAIAIEEVAPAGGAGDTDEPSAAGSEEAAEGAPGRALQLELVQKPQDGSADAALSLALSSSYIMYSAAALERLQAFFHTEQVRLLSCVDVNILRAYI